MELIDLNDLLSPPPRPWWKEWRYQIRRLSPRNVQRNIRWGIQRWQRGYSDCDVWSIDHHLARIIPPMMRQLGRELHGIPGEMVEECGSMEAAEVEWRRILEAVASGFDAWTTMFDEHPQGERLAELEEKWQTGSELLIKHFGSFWD